MGGIVTEPILGTKRLATDYTDGTDKCGELATDGAPMGNDKDGKIRMPINKISLLIGAHRCPIGG